MGVENADAMEEKRKESAYTKTEREEKRSMYSLRI